MKQKMILIKKTKYLDELEKIQEEFNYQSSKLKLLENELNEKNKNIDTLEKNIKDLKNKNVSFNKYKEELEEK